MGAGITDLPDGMHVALEGYDLPDSEFMGQEYFVIPVFQLLVEFQHCSKGHEFKCLPSWRESVIRVFDVVAADNRVALEVRGIDFPLEITGVSLVEYRRADKPYRLGVVLIGEIVYQ